MKSSKQDCPIMKSTPPSSPSKNGVLKSPSKRNRIPPSPHRPSLDAFWSQEVINNWNDEYSPQKPPRTPGKGNLVTGLECNEKTLVPNSPSKSPQKSSKKLDVAFIASRKDFNSRRETLARTFLSELDETITNSQVSDYAAATGGIKIIWSAKLTTTAGRANWRREAIRSKSGDPSSVTHKHHATIELASKVITTTSRLYNVLAHEYCHLATFMISGVKTSPHGAEFKRWAARVTAAFGASHGVEVTTKHDYDISYKYAWQCVDEKCGLIYERHSKSIDVTRQGCGKCKNRLVQLRPAPREAGGQSEYQRFVKGNYERVKREIAASPAKRGVKGGVGMPEVMAALGKEFRGLKAGKVEKLGDDQRIIEHEGELRPPSKSVEGSRRSSSSSTEKRAAVIEKSDTELSSDEGFGDVARKLDFLTI